MNVAKHERRSVVIARGKTANQVYVISTGNCPIFMVDVCPLV